MALKHAQETNQLRTHSILLLTVFFMKIFLNHGMLMINERRTIFGEDLQSYSKASRTSRFLSKLKCSHNSPFNLFS